MTVVAPTQRVTPAVVAAAAFAVVIWGASPFATKLGVADTDPLLVGLLRTIVAAVVSVPLTLLGRVRLPGNRRELGWLAVSATGGFVIFPVFFSLGLRLSTASHGALLIATLPVWTGLVAASLDRRMPARGWLFGCALALAGTAALIAERTGFEGGSDPVFGDLIILVGCVACAFGYVAGAKLSGSLGSWSTTMWGVTIGSILGLPILLGVRGWEAATHVGPAGWIAVFYLAFIVTVIGYIVWYWALSKGGVTRVAPAQFFLPVVGVGLAAIFLGERLTAVGVGAAIVILIGVRMTQRS